MRQRKYSSDFNKVGSTTWYRHFLSLTNSSTRKELEKFGRADQERLMAPSDPDIINLARGSVSFSMVRHPFERIVSAYKDKVISNSLSATHLTLCSLEVSTSEVCPREFLNF